MSVGSVHVYVLKPDGSVQGTLHVAKACEEKGAALEKLLRDAVAATKPKPGPPLVAPRKLMKRPENADDSLVLHITARGLEHKTWEGIPGENLAIFTPTEVRELLPPDTQPGQSWKVPDPLAYRIFKSIRPQTEDAYEEKEDRNRVESAALTGRVIAKENGRTRMKFEGTLRMKRSMYPGKPDDRRVDARLTGFAELNGRQITEFNLVTDPATYAGGAFEAAVTVLSPGE